MAQFYTDFSEYTADVAPSDWLLPTYNSSTFTFTVIANPDDASAKVLSLQGGLSGFKFALWQTPGSSSNTSLLMRTRTTSATSSEENPVINFSETERKGYMGGVVSVADEVRLTKSTPTETTLRAVAKTLTGTTWKWSRVTRDAATGLTRARVWFGLLTDEPATWDVEVTDTDAAIQAAGLCGVFYYGGHTVYVDVFAVGTDGDPAPTSLAEVNAPAITVTPADLPLIPGGTISGTYTNYATIPTTLTVSDGTNTITIASPTITDNGDGTGSFSGTMPALPTTGTANRVLFGDVTVELS